MTFPGPYYTLNFCPNPSFTDGTAGVTSLNSATFFSDPRLNAALNVSTPGNVINEGVQLPPGQMLDNVQGAVSLQMQGSGSFTVSAVDITTSTVLGTTAVTLDPAVSWTVVSITGLSLVDGDNLSVIIETSSIQAVQFWVTKVQYEPATTLNGGVLPTPYCDGDQPNCFWTGTPELSASYKPFEYMISGAGLISTPGIASFLAGGEIVFLVNSNPALGPTVAYGGVDCSGIPFPGIETSTPGYPGGAAVYVSGFGNVVQAGVTDISLPSGLADFAIFGTADVDPAIITIGYNNAGATIGNDNSGAAGWNRVYARYSVPNTQVSSKGWNTWNNGVYFGLGFDFANVEINDGVNIAYVQTEISRYADTGPSPYQRPRALVPVIGATTVNMVTNPAFDTAITGWYPATYNATIALDPVNVMPGRTNSLGVTVTVTNAGAYTVLQELVVGQEYTFSGYVYAQSGTITGVTPFAGSLNGTTVTLTPETWTRVSVTFTATESNTTAGFTATGVGGFDIAQVMCSLGALVAYGDGDSDGWGWEGTDGLSRSYYYERVQVASQFIENIFEQHVPLGQYFYSPGYFEPVAQYSS